MKKLSLNKYGMVVVRYRINEPFKPKVFFAKYKGKNVIINLPECLAGKRFLVKIIPFD